jgi:hypothetical protein
MKMYYKRKTLSADIEICFCTTKPNIPRVLHEDKTVKLILSYLSKDKSRFSSKGDSIKEVSLQTSSIN